MRFLLQVTVEFPEELRDPESPRRAELLAAELERGAELREAGVIERIWRVPGGLRNVAIWSAADPTELHEEIASLPLYPWMRVDVTPLADHPLEGDPK